MLMVKTPIQFSMCVVFLLFTTSVASGQTVWYVDDSSNNGLNDGSSWKNAFLELQSALDVATNGHEIRVAQGTYKPDFDVNSNSHTGDQTASFKMFSGLALYGGYAGFGDTNPDLRDPAKYLTILSGDLAENDGPLFNNYNENSFRVIVAESVDSNGILEGFTVTGGGGYCGLGGGIYNENSSITVANCIFRGNSGGAMLNRISNVTITNCLFSRNRVCTVGGIVHNNGGDLVFRNCTFERNYGSGIYNSRSNPFLANCTFYKNSSITYAGGGVYNYSSAPTLVNCILWNNVAGNDSGEMGQIYSFLDGTPIVRNCCIQGLDTITGNGNIGDDPLLTRNGFHLQSGSPCLDQGDPSGNYLNQIDVDAEPRIIGNTVDIGVDEFHDIDTDGLPDWWEKLYFGSPTAAIPTDDFDQDGNDNITEYAGSTNPLAPPATYYISTDGNDAWDGLASEWDGTHGPKATVQAGINAAHPFEGDTVVVLPGKHTGQGNRDLDFCGKAITVRATNPAVPSVVTQTIIDCEGSDQDQHCGFWFHTKEGTDSVLSGLTIRGGFNGSGAAIKCQYSSPTLSNCVFVGNTAKKSAGALYNYFSHPSVVNCAFIKNSSLGTDYHAGGGGIYNYYSSPSIVNCAFTKNYALDYGGALYSYRSSNPTITNCTFYRNSASKIGGGVFDEDDSDSTLTNCILWNNDDSKGFEESAQLHKNSGERFSSVTFCCIQGLNEYSGNGNIGENPMLSGDSIHLLNNSPCINAGDPNGNYGNQTDIDHEPRHHATRIDIGCDEFIDTDEDGLPDWWETRFFGSTFAALPDGDPDQDNKNNITEYHDASDPVNEPRTYYISINGDDSWDGLSPTWDGEHGPKATVQAGIDIANPFRSDPVVILPGKHTGAGNRDLDFRGKAIEVRSSDPSDPVIVAETVIDCEGSTEEHHRGFWFHSQEGPSSKISGITIRGGSTTEGGAVKCELSSPTFSNCNFENNSAIGEDARGGGVFNINHCHPTFMNCTFNGNSAEDGGGAVNNDVYSHPTFSECTFVGNTTFGEIARGGAMFNTSSSPTLINCTLIQNFARSGGAISNWYGNPIITDCVFNQNTATSSGGAIENYASGSRFKNCTFKTNSADWFGGVLYSTDFEGNDSVWENCTFIENSASAGGCLYNTPSNPKLTGCDFIRNVAHGNKTNGFGGGIYNDDESSPEINACFFDGNVAQNSGGGMYNYDVCRPKVKNSTFRRNIAEGETYRRGGGGIFNKRSYPTIENCNFIENRAYKGGGIGGDCASITLTNCILWGNIDINGHTESSQVSTEGCNSIVSAFYCCIQGLDTYIGNGNIGDNPLLTENGSHLRDDSPCVNQGDPAGDYTRQTDFDGEPRIVGGHVDIGADEFLDTDGDNLPDWWENKHFGSTTSASPNDDVDEDGKDNLTEYAKNSVPLNKPKEIFIAVNGDNSWDGLSPDWDGEHGPKATIQEGISIAHPFEGDSVILMPGTHVGEGNRDLDFKGKSIVIRSIEPTDVAIVSGTIIDCEGSEQEPHRAFKFFRMENSDSELTGITVRNGWANEGGGIRCEFSNPMITKCTFTANTAQTNGGGIYNYYSQPVLLQCHFSENTAVEYGGGSYNYRSNPVFENCQFNNNSGTGWLCGGGMCNRSSNPVLRYCTYRENSGIDGGGLYNYRDSNPTVDACVFLGNSGASGAGLYNSDSSPRITRSLFSGNIASYAGGGVCNHDNGEPTLESCTFTENISGHYGGGMYNGIGRSTLTNCTFAENSTTRDGGGMFIGSSSVLSNCHFSANIANENGGGVYNTIGSSVDFTQCTFRDNSAVIDGGGMFNIQNTNLSLSSCVVSENSAGSDGGGIYSEKCNPTFTNCLFTGNFSTNNGGALFNMLHSHPTITNCTFYGNSAVNECGGIHSYWDSSTTSINNILWGNSDSGGFDESAQLQDIGDSTSFVAYCCIQGLNMYNGYANIDLDPQFVNPHGPDGTPGTIDDNLHLLPTSPCIDSGDPTYDFGLEPEPDGGRINMGAYGNTQEATSKGGLIIEGFMISEMTRIGRTVFAYELSMRISNNSNDILNNITLELNETPNTVTVTDGFVQVGQLTPNTTVNTVDTFTIEVDRTVPVESAIISWLATFAYETRQVETPLRVWFDPANPGALLGDFDSDSDVDLEDFVFLRDCITGPIAPFENSCDSADLNRDGKIDLADFAKLQSTFNVNE